MSKLVQTIVLLFYTFYVETKMENINLMLCFLFSFFIESQSQSFCEIGKRPVVNICTDHFQKDANFIYIDTAKMPQFKQTTCKCVISNNEQQPLDVVLRIINSTSNMEFKIKDTVISNSKNFSIVSVRVSEELLLFSNGNPNTSEMCLGVFIEDTNTKTFNISCKRSSQSPMSSTTLTPTNKENEGYPTFIPIMSTLSGLVCGLLIASLSFFCYRRRKRAKSKDNAEKRSPVTKTDTDDVAGSGTSHYDIIEGTTNGNLTTNNEHQGNNKTDKPKVSCVQSIEGSIYDSAKIAQPKQAIRHNDYDHLRPFNPT